MSFALNPAEALLLEKAANHFRGIEAAGGKLRVTNQRLHFTPHTINLQREPIEIPLDQIVELRRKKTYGLIPNGLVVATKNGKENQFVLWGRDAVIAAVAPYLGKTAAAQPSAAATEAKGDFCEKCGARLRPDAVFCEACGHRVGK